MGVVMGNVYKLWEVTVQISINFIYENYYIAFNNYTKCQCMHFKRTKRMERMERRAPSALGREGPMEQEGQVEHHLEAETLQVLEVLEQTQPPEQVYP